MKGFTEDDDAEYEIHANESLITDDGPAREADDGYRTVGVFSLLVIAFFWASGGIYGNEVRKIVGLWFNRNRSC